MAYLSGPVIRVPDDINDLAAQGFAPGTLCRWNGTIWEAVPDLVYEPLVSHGQSGPEIIFTSDEVVMVGVPR
jgi:hypothetical protein